MTGSLHALPRPHGNLPGHTTLILRLLRIRAGHNRPVPPMHRTLFEGQGK